MGRGHRVGRCTVITLVCKLFFLSRVSSTYEYQKACNIPVPGIMLLVGRNKEKKNEPRTLAMRVSTLRTYQHTTPAPISASMFYIM